MKSIIQLWVGKGQEIKTLTNTYKKLWKTMYNKLTNLYVGLAWQLSWLAVYQSDCISGKMEIRVFLWSSCFSIFSDYLFSKAKIRVFPDRPVSLMWSGGFWHSWLSIQFTGNQIVTALLATWSLDHHHNLDDDDDDDDDDKEINKEKYKQDKFRLDCNC